MKSHLRCYYIDKEGRLRRPSTLQVVPERRMFGKDEKKS